MERCGWCAAQARGSAEARQGRPVSVASGPQLQPAGQGEGGGKLFAPFAPPLICAATMLVPGRLCHRALLIRDITGA